jgi:hypothetical protein
VEICCNRRIALATYNTLARSIQVKDMKALGLQESHGKGREDIEIHLWWRAIQYAIKYS